MISYFVKMFGYAMKAVHILSITTCSGAVGMFY